MVRSLLALSCMLAHVTVAASDDPAPKRQSKPEDALRKFIFPKKDLPTGCKQEVHKLTTSRQFIEQIVKPFFDKAIQSKPIRVVLYSVYKEQDELGIFAMSFDNKANADLIKQLSQRHQGVRDLLQLVKVIRK